MAKLIAPLLSIFAKGSLDKSLTIRNRKKTSVAQKYPLPKDANSPRQRSWRTMYQLAVDLWHQLSKPEKDAWERTARPLHMTGYAYFLSQTLRPNPGIYLPLLGGTMQGDIDMDGHSILNTPVNACFACLPSPDQTIPYKVNTPVHLSSEIYDHGNNYNPATYKFTFPFDALALAITQVTYKTPADGSRLIAYIFKNTTAVANGTQSPGGASGIGPACLAIVSGNQGDTISVQTWHDCSGGTNIRYGTQWTYFYVCILARLS